MKLIESRMPALPSRRGASRPPAAGVPARAAAPTGPRRSSFLKRVGVTGAFGALAFAGFQLTRTPGASGDYDTDKVKRGTLTREVIASGPLVPVLKGEVDSLVPGKVLEVHADFGSVVKADQPLAQIDPSTARLTLREAEIGLGSARAAVEVAKTRAQQSQTLSKEGLLPQTDYDRAVSELKQAEGNARIAEANVSRARIEIDRCTVRSPLDGVVITRNVTVGQSVDTGNGTLPLFVVASDLSRMQIEAN